MSNFKKYNLTPSAKNALKKARKKADDSRQLKVVDFHLLWAILQVEHKTIDYCFDSSALIKEGFCKAMDLIISEYTEPKRKHRIFAPEIYEILDYAQKISKKSKDEYIGIDHILLSILKTRDEISTFISALGVDLAAFIAMLSLSMKEGVSFIEPIPTQPAQSISNKKSISKTLEESCENINERIKDRGTFEIFGRDSETQRAFEILLKKNKSNVVLVGEAGVGKTAIVEGLVERILQSKCPKSLKNKKVYSLDMTSLLAGTMYRGQMEEKVKAIIETASEDEHCILFIDEIHTIIGAGSSEGSLDLANILKPALSRGDVSCIGATTNDEYNKYFKGDSALNRRFEKIEILEPTKEQTLELLQKAKVSYEKFHNVKFKKEILKIIVDLCSEFQTDKKFPDKAFDIIDEAGVKGKMENDENKSALSIDKSIIYDIFASKFNTTIEKIKSKDIHIPGKIGF